METHVEQEFGAEERTWAAFCHLAGLAIFMMPIGGVIGPLVVWMVKREQYPLVNDQGKQALNFQITLLAAVVPVVLLGIAGWAVGLFLLARSGSEPPFALFVIWGAMLLFMGIVALVDIIFIIIASVAAKAGNRYRYPIAIRFIK